MLSFVVRSMALSLVCWTAVADASDAEAKDSHTCPGGRKHYRVTARHIEGGGVGYSQGYTTLEAFAAPDPGTWSWMPFLDARGHVFDNRQWAANAGIGVRRTFADRVYGINTYYDFRSTKKLHYNQVGVGLETLGALWDIRINGYLPVGQKITSPYDLKFDAFSGHNMILSRKYQFAMKGADAEIGFHFGKCRSFDFYGAAGPYYYIGPIGHNIWGGRARLSCSYKDCITLEVSNSYDTQFRNRPQGQLALTLPFGGKSRVKKDKTEKSCRRDETLICRMLDSVGRDEIIVVNHKRKHPIATDPSTGDPLYFVFVDNTSSSQGTYESPYPTLAEAQSNSSSGNIIYVFPGDGTTRNMNNGIFLQPSQKFWGSGTEHFILTGQGGVTVPALSSSAPMITNVTNCVTLATNNEVSGFTITMTSLSGSGITTNVDPETVSISSCTISTNALAEPAIFINTSATSLIATIDNTMVRNGNSNGIVFFLGDIPKAQLILRNNLLTQASHGLLIDPIGNIGECNLTVINNTISVNRSNGIYIFDEFSAGNSINTFTATFDSNVIASNSGGGIVYDADCDLCTITATNNVLSNNGNSGIVLNSPTNVGTAFFAIENNQINGAVGLGNGIEMDNNYTILNLDIISNTINGNSGSGILQFGSIQNENIRIVNNTITNNLNQSPNAGGGISLDLFNNMSATISGNTLGNNTGGDVIGFFTTPSGSVNITLKNNTFMGDSFELDWSGAENVCLNMTGNQSNSNYNLNNLDGGAFHLTPSDVESVNSGIFTLNNVTITGSCP